MISYLLKTVVNKIVPPVTTRYAEDVITRRCPNDDLITLSMTQDDIYLSKYRETKDLFHDAIKSGKLNREQVLYIKMLLNEFLKDYREYYPSTHFKNDAHAIYSMIRSPFLDNTHYETIQTAILKFVSH